MATPAQSPPKFAYVETRPDERMTGVRQLRMHSCFYRVAFASGFGHRLQTRANLNEQLANAIRPHSLTLPSANLRPRHQCPNGNYHSAVRDRVSLATALVDVVMHRIHE